MARSWRTVARLFAVMLGAWIGTELGYWFHAAPDRSPAVETIDFQPRCR